jgi:hypothetical protein
MPSLPAARRVCGQRLTIADRIHGEAHYRICNFRRGALIEPFLSTIFSPASPSPPRRTAIRLYSSRMRQVSGQPGPDQLALLDGSDTFEFSAPPESPDHNDRYLCCQFAAQ